MSKSKDKLQTSILKLVDRLSLIHLTTADKLGIVIFGFHKHVGQDISEWVERTNCVNLVEVDEVCKLYDDSELSFEDQLSVHNSIVIYLTSHDTTLQIIREQVEEAKDVIRKLKGDEG